MLALVNDHSSLFVLMKTKRRAAARHTLPMSLQANVLLVQYVTFEYIVEKF